MAKDTKAQILVFATNLAEIPVAVINRNNNGHPTGKDGTTEKLVNLVTQRVERLGVYDAEHLAAGLVYELINSGVYPYEYGVANRINSMNTRFIYTIRPEGIAVFDARNIEDFEDLSQAEPMFQHAWIDAGKVNEVSKRVLDLETQLAKEKLALESLKRKQFRTR